MSFLCACRVRHTTNFRHCLCLAPSFPCFVYTCRVLGKPLHALLHTDKLRQTSLCFCFEKRGWDASIALRHASPWKVFHLPASSPFRLQTNLGCGGFDVRIAMLRSNATIGRPHLSKQPRGWKRTSTCIRANTNGSDVSVFRFTLGNQVADQQIARFVGGFGGLLLLLNRLDTADASLTDAQRRAEGAGAWLCACCLVCPEVDEKLRQTRRKGTSAPLLRGASNAFVLDRDGEFDASFLQEVAWCTFAILRCTDAKGVLVGVDGRAVAARGSLRETTTSKRDVDRLQEATIALKQASEWRGETNVVGYSSSPASLRRVGAFDWPLVPTGARSLWTSDSSRRKDESGAVVSKEKVFNTASKERGHSVALLVYSDVPLPPKQRLWLSLVLEKLHISCPGSSFNAKILGS